MPNGFAVTAEAYRYTLDAAGVWTALKEALDGLNLLTSTISPGAPRARATSFMARDAPDDVEAEILTA